MDYVKLGSTGMQVSRLALGCMTFGVPERGTHEWTLREEDSRPLIRQALEAGINFLDTANVYSDGTSEEIVGRALKEYASREDVVVATKVHGRMRKGPNGAGLSRKAILHEIDASLARLDLDFVDLYQIHRWDDGTPIEETMEALHDVVKAGKARYLGASSMSAWQFAKAQEVARANGWTPFATMQNHLNLVYREEEREMIPLCIDQGVGLLPWSPLARGRLTRAAGVTTDRSKTDQFGAKLYERTTDADEAVIAALNTVSEGKGVPMAQVALAWVLAKSGVTAPIIGASKSSQLDDAVAALSIALTAEEIAALEAPYVPHPVSF